MLFILFDWLIGFGLPFLDLVRKLFSPGQLLLEFRFLLALLAG